MINVFTVAPANQARRVKLLRLAAEASVRHAPGFISAMLHRSIDGTKVTMAARWRSAEDCQAMRENVPRPPFLQQALSIATFAPAMCEVAETFSGADS